MVQRNEEAVYAGNQPHWRMDSEALPVNSVIWLSFAAMFLVPVSDPKITPEMQVTQFMADRKKMEESTVQVLKRISDTESAKLMLSDLRKLGESKDALAKEEAALQRNPETMGIFEGKRKKFYRELADRGKETVEEYLRLSRIAGVVPLLKRDYPISQIETRLRENASVDLNYITVRTSVYRTLGGGEFPKEIDALTKDTLAGLKKPLLEANDLIDPWGRKYQYDPVGKRNDGRYPDIWSLGPLYEDDKNVKIGNWETMKKLRDE
jgi:Type II secretion system (T2SS), protein G